MKSENPCKRGKCAGVVLAFAAAFPLASCVHVKVDPVRIDATVTIRVERELDDFFGGIDSSSKTIGATDKNPAPQGGL